MASLPLFDSPAVAAPLWTVAELTAQVRATLEADFADIGVRGEVSGLSKPRSGHVYFNLKDDSAQVRAVLWKGEARKLAFDLADGMAVKAFGDLTVYPVRGEYQLSVRRVEPEGVGALELAFRQVVARLAAEGLFDPARKRRLPPYPARIVVVTSPTGAAVRDLLQVLGRRWPAAEVLIAPSKVQGPGAALEIAGAIALANRVNRAELVVVARGGGSLEDLWAFNEEVVARAIYASVLPVVSAVGHEVDVTVADLVADVRALTPTDAGTLCVPDARDVRITLDGLADRLARGAGEPLRRARLRVGDWGGRLHRAMATRLDARRRDLARSAAQLDALSPLGVLARGYSLTQREDGAIVRGAGDVKEGERIRTRLAVGTIVSRVERS